MKRGRTIRSPEIAELVEKSGLDERTVRSVLRALASVVARRERSEFRGLGAFTWRPYRAYLPGGRRVDVEHLWFTTYSLQKKRRESKRNGDK